MASLFNPNYPSILQAGQGLLDPNKPALLQARGGVEAAQRALEAQRAAEAAKSALTDAAKYTPKSSAWTAGSALEPGWGASGKGIGGLLKAASGPVAGGLQALTYSGDADAAELTKEQKYAEMGPANVWQMYEDADAYANRVQENARQANRAPNSPISLMDPRRQQQTPEVTPEQVAEEVAAAEVPIEDASQPAVEQTNVGPVSNSQPATVEQAAAKTAQDQESVRQTVQAGALHGLSTGAVSRPRMAQEIVQADAQRAGKELTPEQSKKAVTEELAVMKGMNNEKLSEYVSYALIAGGLLASFADKSGKAGDAFSQSFNKQLDRNLAMGKAAQQQRMAQAKLDQQLQIKQGDWQRVDRGLDIRKMTADNTAEYQDAQIGLGKDRVDVARGQLGVAQQRAAQGAQSLGLQAQGLGLRAQEISQRQANADRNYDLAVRGMDLREEGNTIKAATAAAKAAASKPGVPLTEKGSAKVVQDFADAQGIKLADSAKSALASQIQNASKNDPQWATNPAAVITKLLGAGGYEPEVDPGIPYVPFTGGGTRVRQKKQ